MKIGIVGAGNMAWALGGRWVAVGHEVMVSGRDLGAAQQVAGTLGPSAQAGEFVEAVGFGDVTLVAVPATAALGIVGGIDQWKDQVVIDCCNPIIPEDRFRLSTADQPSFATRLAQAAPGSQVVKAFNLCASTVWADPTVGAGRFVPLAGGEDAEHGPVGQLVTDLGWTPIGLGGLDRAGQLEAVAALGIRLLVQGIGLESILPFDQALPVT